MSTGLLTKIDKAGGRGGGGKLEVYRALAFGLRTQGNPTETPNRVSLCRLLKFSETTMI